MNSLGLPQTRPARHGRARQYHTPPRTMIQPLATSAIQPGFSGTFGGLGLRCPADELGLQPKLAIGAPNDRYEQEADRISDHVMRMPATNPRLQAMREGAGEAATRAKPPVSSITPQAQRQGGGEDSGDLHAGVEALGRGGQPLPRAELAFFERRFGVDFSRVRIHNDTKAAGLAQALHAQAFTLGNDVVFGSSRYAPHTESGRRLLAHELTHVVQQVPGANGHAMGALIQRQTNQSRAVNVCSEMSPTAIELTDARLYHLQPRPLSRRLRRRPYELEGPTETITSFCNERAELWRVRHIISRPTGLSATSVQVRVWMQFQGSGQQQLVDSTEPLRFGLADMECSGRETDIAQSDFTLPAAPQPGSSGLLTIELTVWDGSSAVLNRRHRVVFDNRLCFTS